MNVLKKYISRNTLATTLSPSLSRIAIALTVYKEASCVEWMDKNVTFPRTRDENKKDVHERSHNHTRFKGQISNQETDFDEIGNKIYEWYCKTP